MLASSVIIQPALDPTDVPVKTTPKGSATPSTQIDVSVPPPANSIGLADTLQVGIGVPTQLQLALTKSFSVVASPSLQVSPIFADNAGQSNVIIGVPTQLQFALTTSFSVVASPSLHASPIFADNAGQSYMIGVPAQLQFPSSTSFSVLASPSLHGVPAAGHETPTVTVNEQNAELPHSSDTVSYTHLTLPTICSV